MRSGLDGMKWNKSVWMYLDTLALICFLLYDSSIDNDDMT
jgi:hypothetical protein